MPFLAKVSIHKNVESVPEQYWVKFSGS